MDEIDRMLYIQWAKDQEGIPVNRPTKKQQKASLRSKHKPRRKYRSWPRGIREYVLMRDKCMCSRCGATDALHVHHIIARCNGGKDEPDNLETLCCRCHALAHIDDPVYKIMCNRNNTT